MGRAYTTVELKTTYFEKRLKNMDLIKSQTLIRSDGSEVEAKSALSEKDLVLIYFSAKWCPQSERYTPMLKEFYEKVSNKGVEVIFASWDKSSEEMLSNMKESHGDWLALKHDFDGLTEKSSGIREELEEKFDVEDLPTLVVMRADGTMVTENGVEDIIDEEASDVIEEWKVRGTDADNFCEIVKGSNLIKADESSKPINEVLAGKDTILIYFSGHWCPPCKRFTPLLKKFYDESAEKGVEVIFVSSDRSSEDMINYMKESHGDWYAFEHGPKIGKRLKKKFKVEGIPTLVVMKPDGTV